MILHVKRVVSVLSIYETGYLKGCLRKKQLMASFVERLKNIHGNIKKHIF